MNWLYRIVFGAAALLIPLVAWLGGWAERIFL
jgi:hypothetical protein